MKPRLARISACAALLLLAGCYEHVVAVHGPASRNIDVQEANIGPGESVWAEDKPHAVDPDRYPSYSASASATTVDRSKAIPTKPVKKGD